MANLSSEFSRSYNSFAGVDIRAVFGETVIGTLQGISWSVAREKLGVYTMGSPDVRAFARGKRGISGSLVFIQFDEHALLNSIRAKFWADKDSLKPDGLNVGPIDQASRNAPGSTIFNQESVFGNVTDPRDDQVAARPWFVDQIPPFDITLTAANEYGAAATMRIYGVELLNSGSGASIDDIVLEEQMSYVARTIQPWSSAGPVIDPNSQ